MSRHPDPCYCEQAKEYEEFIRKIQHLLPDGHDGDNDLWQEAEDLVNKYEEAQKKYEAEGK